ncbi:hypothetical protein EMIT0P100_320011 [Pseudomonas sp. IT-P100]
MRILGSHVAAACRPLYLTVSEDVIDTLVYTAAFFGGGCIEVYRAPRMTPYALKGPVLRHMADTSGRLNGFHRDKTTCLTPLPIETLRTSP